MKKIILFFMCIVPSISLAEDKLSSFYSNGDYESIVKQLEDTSTDDLDLYELNLLGNAYNRIGDENMSKLYYFLASLNYPQSGEIKNNLKIIMNTEERLNQSFLKFGMSNRELIALINIILFVLIASIFFYKTLIKSLVYNFLILGLLLSSTYISITAPKLDDFKVLHSDTDLKSGYDPKAFSFQPLKASEIVQVKEQIGRYLRVSTIKSPVKTGWIKKEDALP